MKKSYSFKKKAGRKNMIMCLVALVLILITVVGTSYSWIEEVSKVEFNSDNGQETPYKMEAKPLKADASFIDNNTQINLADYFNEGGDMHLSPCYSDGEKFYFPVNNSTSTDKYRLGTKDDANTNYISATFNVKSTTANTSYWFEKIDASTNYLTLSDHSGASVATFPDEVSGSTAEDYLRISVTIDGNTNVYCYNANGKYHKVTGINDDSVDEVQGRRVETYAYYDASNIADQTANRNVSNQNSDNTNLHCNTLFTVPKGQTKTVTIKIWLECRGSGSSLNVRDVRVSNINFRLTSSWAKMRRIYVLDRTIFEDGYDKDQWLGTYGGALFWGLKDDLDTYFALTADGTETIDGVAYNKYYVDIPTIYNGTDAVLFRCNGSYNNGNSDSYSNGGKTVNCWNHWVTAFPDTFHNETFSVYSSSFGTWSDSDVNAVYFVNSGSFASPKAYMWDSASVISGKENDINGKVVKNADWPGVNLSKLKPTTSHGWSFSSTENDNCKLTTGSAGYYTFIFMNDSNLVVTYSSLGTVTSNSDTSVKYHLVGKGSTLGSWATGNSTRMVKAPGTGNCYYRTVNLAANTTYEFKVKKEGTTDTYYSNSGTINVSNVDAVSHYTFYTFFYNSDYDRIIFSDGISDNENKEYQTQDLWVKDRNNANLDWSNKTFDMATLTWFDATPDNPANLPKYSASNTYLKSNFVTGNRYVHVPFAYGGQYGSTSGNAFNGTSSTHMMCKFYCKADDNGDGFNFQIVYNGVYYGAYKDGDHRVTAENNYKIDNVSIPKEYGLQNDDNHRDYLMLRGFHKGDVIRVYFDTSQMKVYLAKGEN